MSFRIFASGTVGFGYTRNGIQFGDVYDAASALQMMTSAPSAPPQSVGEAAAGEAGNQLSASSPVQQSLNAIGQIQGLHLLRDSLTMTLAQRMPLHITLNVRKERMAWVDYNETDIFLLDHYTHFPQRRFMNTVNRVLEATEMNGFGVLAALSEVLARYGAEGSRGNDRMYRLLIQVSG